MDLNITDTNSDYNKVFHLEHIINLVSDKYLNELGNKPWKVSKEYCTANQVYTVGNLVFKHYELSSSLNSLERIEEAMIFGL